MTESFSASVKVHPVSGMPRSLTVGAVVGADGSVVYRTALFTSSGMRDLFGSGLSNYVMASWLPEAMQVVSGRRQITTWPFEQDEPLALTMPIVDTTGAQAVLP